MTNSSSRLKYRGSSGFVTNLRSVTHLTLWEFKNNVLSGRMMIGLGILTFAIVAGSMGISAMSLRPHTTVIPETLTGSKACFVLYLVSFMVGMIGSIMVLILSFDAFSKDKETGAVDVLVSRPITKRGIALSKFMGINLAMSVYIVPLLWTSINIIEGNLHETLPMTTKIWYIVITLALFASMSLVQMLLSLAAKNAGSAVMYGVSVWFLYTIFWLLVSLTIAQYMGLNVESVQSNDFARISNRVDLFNPIGAFHLCTGILLAGQNEVITIPHWWAYTALLLWVIIPLLAMIEIYRRQE